MPGTGGLEKITTIERLLDYVRDKLDWPLEEVSGDPVEDLFYDYTPDELHLKPEHAAAIREVHQLRPLDTNCPWGIFFVSFEDKAIRIGPLRQMLRALVVRRRETAEGTEQRKWQLGDLLFISSFGASGDRQLCFAHFHQDPETGDLPALRVLGWNDKDTKLHLTDVHDKLTTDLKWPQDTGDLAGWREQWAKPFRHTPGQIIRESKELAAALANLAVRIREAVEDALDYQTDEGPLSQLMEAFKQNLIHDLDQHRFADMFAQTISYGLLTAKFARPTGLIADNLVDMIPSTNPFLRELFETFFALGGRSKRDELDFDVLGIKDVVDMLNGADTEAVKLDFGDKNPDEDPTIHFYELFLKEYDPGERVKRGVYYTPRPVVSFIVRSVDEILQKEFGLADGLADTTTWGEMAGRNENIKIPEGVSTDEPFVQILDPATGTGTFLVEVIDLIEKRMKGKWVKRGQNKEEIVELWNSYVPEHLLPRLTGFELMMAPYAIAHMKIGLKLFETGYRFLDDVRARIYLTNTLEPAREIEPQFEAMAPALAHEAKAASSAKDSAQFTVVVGNPPYSTLSQNMGQWIKTLVRDYRFVDGQEIKEKGKRNHMQDDYVKFFRVGQLAIERAGVGVLGYISNHSFLESPTFRGMRNGLLKCFSQSSFIDLNGNAKRAPDSRELDQNVFEIQQGVSITICRRSQSSGDDISEVEYQSMLGSLDFKISKLQKTVSTIGNERIYPRAPYYFINGEDPDEGAEYESCWKIDKIMPIGGTGIKTNRDGFVIDFEIQPLKRRMDIFADEAISDNDAKRILQLKENYTWKIEKARRVFRETPHKDCLRDIEYRPFDTRKIYYHKSVVFNPRFETMSNASAANVFLLTCRQQYSSGFRHALVTRNMFECCVVSAKSREITSGFPLYVLRGPTSTENDLFSKEALRPNFRNEFVAELSAIIGLTFVTDEYGDLQTTFGARDLLQYIYSILHSPYYRQKYAARLKIDFPRIFLSINKKLFGDLAQLGGHLIELHLLNGQKVPELQKRLLRLAGSGDATVAHRYPTYENGKVLINPGRWFEDVPQEAWEFYIGGFQPCQKWLKDRAEKRGKKPRPGRVLTETDIKHYGQMVTAIAETIKLMDEIDLTINKHGGWPDAFYVPPPPPPTIEEIVAAREGQEVEYKSTFQSDTETGKKHDGVRKSALKTIVAFLNCNGGTLAIGVTDEGEIFGLEKDFALISKDDKKEWFRQTVVNAINNTIGEVFTNSYDFRFSKAGDGKEVFIIDVKEHGPKPAFLKFEKGQDDEFFVRTDNKTVQLKGSKQYDYIKAHWD